MKKTKIFLMIFTLVLFISATSCNGNSGDNSKKDNTENSTGGNDNPIVGKWEIIKAEGMSASINEGQIYEFSDDGNAKVSSANYTYKIDGDTLYMDYEGAGNIILEWTYEIDGDNMTLDNNSSADQTFWMERK